MSKGGEIWSVRFKGGAGDLLGAHFKKRGRKNIPMPVNHGNCAEYFVGRFI